MSIDPVACSAGFPDAGLPERLGLPDPLDAAQREAADEMIDGPRGAVYGPFRAMLHRPALMRAVGKVGEVLRYHGTLDAALREWTICAVARATGNPFEWEAHVPAAIAAGVPADALLALGKGDPTAADFPEALAVARRMAEALAATHRIGDATWADAAALWDHGTLVELVSLIGYFAMVCWIMNAARTPGPGARG